MLSISDDTVCVSLVLVKFLAQLLNTVIHFILHPLHFEAMRLHIFYLGNVLLDVYEYLVFRFNSKLL